MMGMRGERGVVLAVSLIILLVLTILGTAGMRTTLMQERMAGSMRELNLAFQAAEAALREGELLLEAAALPAFDGTEGYWHWAATDKPDWTASSHWSASNTRAFSGALFGVDPPRYFLEQRPAVSAPGSLEAGVPLPDAGVYRVTARAVGGTAAEVVLQVEYMR
jgi:type IV pilus assembly protein PilX